MMLGAGLLLGGAACTTSSVSTPVDYSTMTPSTTNTAATKRYVLTDPKQCAAARFTCNQNEEYFSDDQGCGCEISNNNQPPAGDSSTDMIPVISPVKNSVVTSPVSVQGWAPHDWLVNGKLQVRVLDSNNTILGSGTVAIANDFQENNMDSFLGSITFSKSTTSEGKIVIAGTFEGATNNSWAIPVRFDSVTSTSASGNTTICPDIYQPVCGSVVVECIKAPCPPLKQTFSNECDAKRNNAQDITNGACVVDDQTSPVEFIPPFRGTLKSPALITGEAVGTWFSEGSFRIDITDKNGKVLGTGVAKAQGDAHTTQKVPFQVSVTFTAGSAKEGFVVAKKDNPSGDPKKDQSVKVPVQF